MAASTQWQLSREAAERYEEILVPAILGPAAAALVELAAPRRNETVADVGCGTGAAARFASTRIGGGGRIIGIDVNPGMIDIAREVAVSSDVPIEWRVGNALELPLENASVDLLLCAQVLQFLDDATAAVAEMRRVLKPGGRAAISTWTAIDENAYFAALADAIATHIGAETANGLRAAFRLSSAEALQACFAPHFELVHGERCTMDLALPDLEAFVPRHVGATPMAQAWTAASEATRAAVVRDVVRRLDNVHARFSQNVLIALA